jgi:PTH1 family peptidyl-tRNA hydrolase
MKLIVGLGNPGARYAASRHNLGFQVLDRLAARYGLEREQKRFDAWLGSLRWPVEKVLLAKPQTYMNLSGRAVQQMVRWHKLALGDLIVVYDDLDLPPGQVRIRAQGSAGGHKGMISIIECLGSQDFARVRIGIGRPMHDTVDWVLGSVSAEEQKIFNQSLDHAANALECWVKKGIAATMNEYN